MPWLQRSVLPRAALTVVPVSDNHPLDTLLLVVSCSRRNSSDITIREILDLVRFSVGGIDGADQHVVRDVIKMAAVFKPRASH